MLQIMALLSGFAHKCHVVALSDGKVLNYENRFFSPNNWNDVALITAKYSARSTRKVHIIPKDMLKNK